jgi:hypothetical protein
MGNDSRLHELRLAEIRASPRDTIGLVGVLWSAPEVQRYSKSSGRLLAEIDLLFHTGTQYKHPYTVIEYKASARRREKAIEQLARASQFVREYMGAESHQLFVWYNKNHYAVERIK